MQYSNVSEWSFIPHSSHQNSPSSSVISRPHDGHVLGSFRCSIGVPPVPSGYRFAFRFFSRPIESVIACASETICAKYACRPPAPWSVASFNHVFDDPCSPAKRARLQIVHVTPSFSAQPETRSTRPPRRSRPSRAVNNLEFQKLGLPSSRLLDLFVGVNRMIVAIRFGHDVELPCDCDTAPRIDSAAVYLPTAFVEPNPFSEVSVNYIQPL